MKKKIIMFMLGLIAITNTVNANAKNEVLYEKNNSIYLNEEKKLYFFSNKISEKSSIVFSEKLNDNILVTKAMCFDEVCEITYKGRKSGNVTSTMEIDSVKVDVVFDVKSINEVRKKRSSTVDEQYELEIAKIFKKYNVKSMEDSDNLPNDRFNAFISEIEEIKDKMYPEENDGDEDVMTRGTWDKYSDAAGDVLLTTSASTGPVNHGHAGIHHGHSYVTIEANPGQVVKKYPNRIKTYWRKIKGGRYSVKGASRTQNLNAVRWAIKQYGKPYSLTPLTDNGFFCTKLVWRSWESQSKKIGHYYFAGDMMKSTALKRVAKYN